MGEPLVYMLRCGDGTLYTGWTNDLNRRLKTHAAGKGGKYTRARLPRAEKLRLLKEDKHAQDGT